MQLRVRQGTVRDTFHEGVAVALICSGNRGGTRQSVL